VTEPPTAGGDTPVHDGLEKTPEEHELNGHGVEFPASRILGLIGDKWTTVVLYCLSREEVRRFNELQRQIPEISKKMLVQTLRGLERDGLVDRKVYPQVPPKTEYRLTDDGHRLREPIAELCLWAVENEKFLTAVIARRNG